MIPVRPWMTAELVALDARPDAGAFARFRLDGGEILTVDRTRYHPHEPVVRAIAEIAGVATVEVGANILVKLRLENDDTVGDVADIDGGRQFWVGAYERDDMETGRVRARSR